MFAIYVVGWFFGLLLGVPIGFYWGARHIERLVQREHDRRIAELTNLLDWQE